MVFEWKNITIFVGGVEITSEIKQVKYPNGEIHLNKNYKGFRFVHRLKTVAEIIPNKSNLN